MDKQTLAVVVPVVNETNEVMYDEEGNIYVYNKLNKTTGFMEDTAANRHFLRLPHRELLETPEAGPTEIGEEASQLSDDDEVSCKWTDKTIKLLLSCYQEHLHLFKSAKKTNKAVWNLISKKFVTMGYSFTGDQCDLKFRNLKKTYKRIKDNNNSTGRGAIQWPYFQQFDEIFGKDVDVNPELLCLVSNASDPTYSSRAGSSSSNETSCCSSRAESTMSDNDSELTPRSKKRKSRDDEPEWAKQLRLDAAARHQEKMELLKELIDVLKNK